MDLSVCSSMEVALDGGWLWEVWVKFGGRLGGSKKRRKLRGRMTEANERWWEEVGKRRTWEKPELAIC